MRINNRIWYSNQNTLIAGKTRARMLGFSVDYCASAAPNRLQTHKAHTFKEIKNIWKFHRNRFRFISVFALQQNQKLFSTLALKKIMVYIESGSVAFVFEAQLILIWKIVPRHRIFISRTSVNMFWRLTKQIYLPCFSLIYKIFNVFLMFMLPRTYRCTYRELDLKRVQSLM